MLSGITVLFVSLGVLGRDLDHGAGGVETFRLAAGALGGLLRTFSRIVIGLLGYDAACRRMISRRSRPRCERSVVPAYSFRYSPRRCNSGTTLSTKSSNAPGK